MNAPGHTGSAFDRAFPALAKGLPRVALGHFPTPLDADAAFARELGVPALLVKRDDQSAAEYGGNKVRKLEYALGEALQQGCDAVLTFGALGSNHALATAIYARKLGLHCYAVLTDQPDTPAVAETLARHRQLGTTIARAASLPDSVAVAAELVRRHPTGADRVYELTWGGSSVTGTIGFVAAAFELAEQLRARPVQAPYRIYLPCGTLGTAAGLLLGLRAARVPAVVVGVKVVPRRIYDRAALIDLAERVNRHLTVLDPTFPPLDDLGRDLDWREEFLGEGYARATPEGLAAIDAAARHGYRLDITYSAKAFAALRADAGRDQPAAGTPLFWLTKNSR